ncbi:MAG: TonB-dependent receptor plug domain-containing protein, partial [Candidatus Binatia bacterium]
MKHVTALSAVIWLCVSSASGQEDAGRRVIEEIVVTAQKREQRVEDVPISISVIDEELIAEQGFTDIRDAMLFAPNVQIETTTLFTSPRCRGFSVDAGRNRAFEPPCGLALNGVPYTRPAYFQGALFDLQRIEVLRGPQGTTFGKNTTAALINL